MSQTLPEYPAELDSGRRRLVHKNPDIYWIRNTVNGKFYIGSSHNPYRRWQEHVYALQKGQHKNQHLQAAWCLHGKTAFQFQVIELIAETELLKTEQWYLDNTRCLDPQYGYNVALEAAAPTKGRTYSLESRQRMSAAQHGRPKSESTKQKIREALKGRKFTKEEREKHLGKKMPNSHREKQKNRTGKLNHASKPVRQHTRTGELINCWESCGQASRATGVSQSAISAGASGRLTLIRGKRKSIEHAGGFIWRYEEAEYVA